MFPSLSPSATTTVIAEAFDLHVDTPKKNPVDHKLLSNNKGFVETRVLLPIDRLSSHRKDSASLGRGGAGPGIYVLALIDHSVSFKQKTGLSYTSFRNCHHLQMTLSQFYEVVNNPNDTELLNENVKSALQEHTNMLS